MITEADVLKALSNVDDPDFGKDIVSLNMVKDIKIEVKLFLSQWSSQHLPAP